MKVASNFSGIMRSMAIEKKTGTLTMAANDWSSSVVLHEGQVLRANHHSESGWALGQALVQSGILSPVQALKAFEAARKRDEEPEAVLLDNEWVALTVLKRFRERLNMLTLVELSRKSGYRVEFKATEGPSQKIWDTMVPVSFALREVSRKMELLDEAEHSIPSPESRFEKCTETLSNGFDVEDLLFDHIPFGPETERYRLNEEEKRVLFFCNGEVDFKNLPIVSGVSPERASKILHRLASMRLIRPATGPGQRASWSRGDSRILRYGAGFLLGVLATALTFIFIARASNLLEEGEGYPPPTASQETFTWSRMATLREIQSALVQYKLETGALPKALSELVLYGTLSSRTLNTPLLSGGMNYTVSKDKESFRLEIFGQRETGQNTTVFGGALIR